MSQNVEVKRRRVVVTTHALQQFISRNPELADLPWEQIRKRIADEVRVAIAEGRVENHKTDGFVLYAEKRKQLPPKQRFVCSEDGRHAWIIVREDHGDDVVVTSLTRAGVRR